MMMANDLILWSDKRFTSPWVLSVWAALKEKGVSFDVRTLDLKTGENRKGEFADRTILAKVPAITHQNFWLTESMAILEYVEEIFPAPKHRALLPRAPEERARDRQIMAWLRSDLSAVREAMPFEGHFWPTKRGEITERTVQDIAKVIRVAELRAANKSDGFPTFADFDLCFMLRRLIQYDYDLAKHPDIVSFVGRIWNRDSVQSWVKVTRARR